MTFQILRSNDGGYFWRIRGGNGETLAVSEVYRAKSSALHAVAVVKAEARNAPVHDLT